jgi:hypothetical protein
MGPHVSLYVQDTCDISIIFIIDITRYLRFFDPFRLILPFKR